MITFENDDIVLNPRHTLQVRMKNAIGKVTYEIEDKRIATVDENGKLLAKRPGTTKLYASTGEDQYNWTYVKVKYHFWQWLLVIFLFGWICVNVKQNFHQVI